MTKRYGPAPCTEIGITRLSRHDVAAIGPILCRPAIVMRDRLWETDTREKHASGGSACAMARVERFVAKGHRMADMVESDLSSGLD